jgi:diguanylate cyclase (GGDEF)-like protein/PAS domain S-box-containing protein
VEHAPDPLKTGNIALLEVLEGLPDATVGAARDGRIVFINGLAEEQFGYGRDELIGQPIETLWPERVRGRYRRNLDLYFELEHPLRFTERAYGRRKDGSEFIGEMSWGIVNSDDGPLLLAIGRNISERLESESRLRRQSEQQAAVAALGERALRGVEPSELAREAAERVREVLGADRVEVLEGPREIAAWGALGRSASSVSVPIHTGDRVHGALVATSPDEQAFGDEEGSFLQAIANVLAVGFSRLNLEEQMRQQALHDSLTGLANRTLCRDRILHALAVAEREESNAAVLFVDIDNFKRVNDEFGHQQGDEVLASVASVLREHSRDIDQPARYGGEELAVVLPQTDVGGAVQLAERMREAIEALQIPRMGANGHLTVTASFGVASFPESGDDKHALIAAADAALYRAKRAGKNQVHRAESVAARR